MPSDDSRYPIGHSDAELARLRLQGAYYRASSLDFFASAGIDDGMSVLDFGCGIGETTFLLAELVGGRGRVVGVDGSAASLAVATQRAEREGLTNIAFVLGDERVAASLDEDFDACAGRLVLMYQKAPAETLAALTSGLRPGALVAFEETNLADRGRSHPPVPLFEQCWDWAHRVCETAGIEMNMGYRLRQVFIDAGLDAPAMRIFGRPAGLEAPEACSIMAGSIGTLLPHLERYGCATPAEVDLPTLEARLIAEVRERNAVIVPAFHIGASGRR